MCWRWQEKPLTNHAGSQGRFRIYLAIILFDKLFDSFPCWFWLFIAWAFCTEQYCHTDAGGQASGRLCEWVGSWLQTLQNPHLWNCLTIVLLKLLWNCLNWKLCNVMVIYPFAPYELAHGPKPNQMAMGPRLCKMYIFKITGWIYTIWRSTEGSRPTVVQCHDHFPICPTWDCPLAKNFSNLLKVGSRLCRMHISEASGQIFRIQSSLQLWRPVVVQHHAQMPIGLIYTYP